MKRCSLAAFQLLVFCGLFSITCLFTSSGHAEPGSRLSTGQTVYVSVYSHVFHGPRERPFDLTDTLSIRNADLASSISIVLVDYYDSDGKLLKRYLEKPITLGPLASKHYAVKESDQTGGFGANFIVKWTASKKVNEPVIECVMISTKGQQGISFITQGRVIQDVTK